MLLHNHIIGRKKAVNFVDKFNIFNCLSENELIKSWNSLPKDNFITPPLRDDSQNFSILLCPYIFPPRTI